MRALGSDGGGGAENAEAAEMELSASQQRAVAAARAKRSLFVTGPAGVGKSFCMVGAAGYCSPRHRMPFNPRNEGSKHVHL